MQQCECDCSVWRLSNILTRFRPHGQHTHTQTHLQHLSPVAAAAAAEAEGLRHKPGCGPCRGPTTIANCNYIAWQRATFCCSTLSVCVPVCMCVCVFVVLLINHRSMQLQHQQQQSVFFGIGFGSHWCSWHVISIMCNRSCSCLWKMANKLQKAKADIHIHTQIQRNIRFTPTG